MRTLDMVMLPLRASRAALAPYVENMQSGYHGAEEFAREKAQALARRAPKAVRVFGNRYVLISLAAGACLLIASRLRRWRANGRRPYGAAHRVTAKMPARKGARTHARGARVH